MKIQYASDLHLEFTDNSNYLKNNPIKPVGDILILAGDITYLNYLEREIEKEFINYVSDNFKTTYLMLGNHEFYGGASCDMIDNPVNERLRDNVFLVNNTSAKHENTLILFTTGLGTPTGNPVCPVIKVATNSILAKKMKDIIDIDCGPIISGEKTIEQMGEDILDYCIKAASGDIIPKAVQLNQDDFIPWKRGVSL